MSSSVNVSTSNSDRVVDVGISDAPTDGSEIQLSGEGFVEFAKQDKIDLFKHIGSLMFHVYNDAKRTTLSGWSFPSQYVVNEFARNFKFGITSTPKIDLRYVTPSSHAELLSCIVESDAVRFTKSLEESLAVSLRLDAYADRSQKHNLFVMVRVVTKHITVETLCHGFDIPKLKGATGYVECLQGISKTYLPWDDFFKLISSLVTDGEALNLGRLNDHVQKLKTIRNLSPSKLPLISIWCVPHRTNLASSIN